MKVLCFGSLNIDYVYSVAHFVSKGETLASTGLQVFTGGKGLNQSIALAKAGCDVYHAGAIGPDGVFLLEAMQEAGVNTEYVSILENARSGNAIIQRNPEGDNCILLFGGTNRMITTRQIDAVLVHFCAGDYLIVQNEINNLSYILEQAHAKGMIIVLNPSPMNDGIRELPLAYVDIFMLNEVEAFQILNCGRETGHAQLPEMLQAVFPQAAIVLTLGSEGAIYMNGNSHFVQQAYPVKVADTTAAGDTFTGFFIGGLIAGKSRQAALQTASAAAAITCSRPGAASSIPSIREVLEFIKAKPVNF